MKNNNQLITRMLSLLTLEEKIALVAGTNFMYTNAVKRLKIPSIRMSDGPHGLRVQGEVNKNGVSKSEPATSFPTASCSANSWNTVLLEKMGRAMGKEASHYNIDVILGPGVNIKRNPLCGRNFEYFSEDPFLTGRLGASEVTGIQKEGIGVAVKHFAANNSENYRFMGDSIVDERALREIYFRHFEHIVKTTKPQSVMCAYNKINGEYCCENNWLLNDVLRKEWGFEGLVMSDWGATHDRVKGIKSGLDLEMPGGTTICRKWLYDAINDHSLNMEELDKAVYNVLNLVFKHQDKERLMEIPWDEHHQLAKEIALEGAVLLKNNGALPLQKDERILVIGELFEKMRYQGAGSSLINPYMRTTAKEVFDNENINYEYVKGYQENKIEPDQKLIDAAIDVAKKYHKVILFLGLTDYIESEGIDRNNLSLPANQLALIDAFIKLEKEIVVVLFGGSVIELPFFDNVSAILNMFLPGQNGGEATYELLYGIANPSGKLAETWPYKYSDVPFYEEYSKNENEVYKESIYVGYRYYLTADKEVRFPFGYGLSYTTYKYSALNVTTEDNFLNVSLVVTNTGTIKGKEIIQVYVAPPKGNTHKPTRELKGFIKISLEPKESKEVSIKIAIDNLTFWAPKEGRFVLEKGEYTVEIGENCRDIVLKETIALGDKIVQAQYSNNIEKLYNKLNPQKISNPLFEEMAGLKIPALPPSKPITLESRFTNLSKTFLGRIFYRAVLNVARKEMKEAKKMIDSPEKENRIKGAFFLKQILESNSLISLSMSSSNHMPYNFACGFRDISNGKVFKGIKQFMTKIKAPDLPSNKEEE
ncbi:MAG: Thermostable beta-glucosidase B [Tenericutes bacterium ADurb.Bin239]|nr:MAG: Thermostable beta-glucosidase B [Tenericutes bacterium ADurb.Bin239]